MIEDLNSRYGLTPVHSEVVQACEIVEPCHALDMGCSNGRNTLYLSQLGFNVTALDINSAAIDMLKNIGTELEVNNITPVAIALTSGTFFTVLVNLRHNLSLLCMFLSQNGL